MATRLTTKAKDKSTYIVTCSFKDENGNDVTPNTITWKLTDDAGNIINSRTAQTVTPAAAVDIVLSGNDLKYSDGPVRILTVEATYNSLLGTNLPLNEEVKFNISDLINI
jgi:hypothetical protein